MPPAADVVRRPAEDLLAGQRIEPARAGRDAHDRLAQGGLAHAVAADDARSRRRPIEADSRAARARCRRRRRGREISGVCSDMGPSQVEVVDELVGADLGRRAFDDHDPSCIIVTRSATVRATSMSCSMSSRVTSRSRDSSSAVSSCRSAGTAPPPARRAAASGARRPAPARSPAAAARRATGRRPASPSRSVMPTLSAVRRARSRAARVPAGAQQPEAAAGRRRSAAR